MSGMKPSKIIRLSEVELRCDWNHSEGWETSHPYRRLYVRFIGKELRYEALRTLLGNYSRSRTTCHLRGMFSHRGPRHGHHFTSAAIRCCLFRSWPCDVRDPGQRACIDCKF